MNLPSEVRVGPYIYPVEEDQRISEATGTYGRITYQPHRITLDPNTTESRMITVLMHEVLHAIFDYIDLDSRLADGLDETTITALTPALVDTLQRNPELVKAIMDSGAV